MISEGKRLHNVIGASKRRGLGYNALNKPFKNCDAHHIDDENIIFIPVNMHRNFPHKRNDQKSMDIINDRAIEFYWSQIYPEDVKVRDYVNYEKIDRRDAIFNNYFEYLGDAE